MRKVKQLAKNRNWLFFCIYFFYWMAHNSLEPYLGVFYESRGLTGTQIGIAASVFSIATVIAAMVSGVIEDHVGRPNRMLPGLLCGMMLFTGILYFSSWPYLIFTVVFLYGFCSSPVSGIVDKVLLDELQDHPEKFSFFRTGGTTGAGVGVLVAGLLYRGDSALPLFLTFWGLLVLCAVSAWHMPQEHLSEVQRPKLRDYWDLIKSRYFLPIYLPTALWGFTESSVLQFLALHIAGTGYSTQLTSIFIAAAMCGEFLAFLIAPFLARRLPQRMLFIIAFLLQFLRVLSLTLLAYLPLPLVVLCQFFGGGCYAILYSLITAIIGQIYPEKISYSAHSLKMVATRGVGMTCGALMLGVFFDMQRITAGYGVLSVVAGLLLLYYVLPIPKRVGG